MKLITKLLKLPYFLYRLPRMIWYKTCFKYFGLNSCIETPLYLQGKKNIWIGNKVHIKYKVWLAAVPLTGAKEVHLKIDNGCSIGHFNEIYATKSIVLEKNVLTADRVYISDNLHGYDDISTPILHQPIKQNKTVRIGEGSWLGVGVCVLGANIGRHCVVGANSVVTRDIPDYCVAVGAPAKVIKKYDFITRKWMIYTNLNGNENAKKNGGGNLFDLQSYTLYVA